MSGRAVFIAGTDTGIGKTHVSVALLHALRERGQRSCGMKPVASGCVAMVEGLRNDDALTLQAASSGSPSYALINPVSLRDPLSPHLAAAHDGVSIELGSMRPTFDALCDQYNHVVVEGIGGWLVPLGPSLLASDIAIEWQLPVILVVGLRLGCLNHSLLSARAIQADGCRLLGWIGNAIDPQMEALEENLDTLRERLPAPCLGVLPWDVPAATATGELAAAVAALGA